MKNAASGKFHLHIVIKIVLFLPTNLHFNINSIHKYRMPSDRHTDSRLFQRLSTLDITVDSYSSTHPTTAGTMSFIPHPRCKCQGFGSLMDA